MTSESKSEKYDNSIPEEEPLNKDEQKTSNKKGLIERLKHIKRNVTVEPIFSGLVIASTLSRLAIQNLNLDKACRAKLGYSNEICDALIKREGNLSFYEGEIQRVISEIETWKSIIQTAIPTLLVIFMGAYSDRTGNRKICILLPLLGEFITCISNIICTFFFYQISVEATMFMEAFFIAVSGGWVMVFLGVFSYVSDITSEKTRTYRVGIVNLCLTAGIPIGTSLSGILLKLFGYYGVFSISAIVYLLTFIYGVYFLKSVTKPGVEGTGEKALPVTSGDVIKLVRETADVAFKKRDGNTRQKIILTLLVVAIIYGPDHGERILLYMFVRYRLRWDALKFSMYSTYGIITHFIGALFSISVFSKRWGFHDSMLCLISIVSKLAGTIFIIFVHTDFQMFMVPLVEILHATTFTSLRSMASKLVPSEELGKMNSLFSLVETLAALIFDPTYSAIYSRTVHVQIATVYIFSALMTLPAISLLLWFFIQHRREIKRKLEDVQESEDMVVNELTVIAEMPTDY